MKEAIITIVSDSNDIGMTDEEGRPFLITYVFRIEFEGKFEMGDHGFLPEKVISVDCLSASEQQPTSNYNEAAAQDDYEADRCVADELLIDVIEVQLPDRFAAEESGQASLTITAVIEAEERAALEQKEEI
jgi:hypothetical protein